MFKHACVIVLESESATERERGGERERLRKGERKGKRERGREEIEKVR